ncbi:MAG TPA: DNA topoisomerase III [Spirochaetota bacterium]|jgi:DNA topoisomerase-3|nr:MAG: DNA topoisomerase 3 [Spirochaetes bacterium ADurb.Bin133]HNZ27758.1 DNA topoisomerase III [Spirochaetota bacterium]HPY87916.1 DNA topoisomerase III [Spirochaetota bacterium]
MKSVVLAEKPSVGKELARILKCSPRGKSCCEGDNYIVTWAMGHLVELADPGSYYDEWNSWKMETLPMLPDKMKLKVIGKTGFQFTAIKNIFNRQDVNNLIIATDAGREGELVARWIMKLAGWKKNFQRLWISSQTDKAIKDGFSGLKDGRRYDNLFRAAECRAEADWIVGLNVTRALSCRYDAKLSAGRVQTPTLAMIVNRESEIKMFKSRPYWTIGVDLDGFKAVWQAKNGQTRFFNQSDAGAIVEKINGKNAFVKEVDVKEKSDLPPLAFNLNDLQREANKVLGFSAKQTLNVLQGLYERHKIVTYPRTDSRHLTTDMLPTLKDRLKAIENSQFSGKIRELLKNEINSGKRLIDDAKVSDHHAIIPTEEPVRLEKLSREEKILWEIIAKRFIAVLSNPYRYKSVKLVLDINGESFVSKGVEVVDPGWKSLYGVNITEVEEDEDIPTQNLKIFQKGEEINVKRVNILQGLTKPPARYTEGALLEAMENAGKFIDDKALKESIQKGGIGTPATRADIIEKLFSNYYIEKNGKELVPTPQGMELVGLVPELLRSPELTAEWEIRLNAISEGKELNNLFSKDIRDKTKELVEQVKNSTVKYEPKANSRENCPYCGKPLISNKDKKGRKILICPSKSCGYERDQFNDNDSPTNKEKQIARKYMNKYGANKNSKETFTLGDMLKAKMEIKKE